MTSRPGTDEGVRTERRGTVHMQVCAGIGVDAVLAAVRSPGTVLKESKKSLTRRVGDWVVKSSRTEGGLGVLKHTFARARYRAGWLAAHHLARHGVLVPRPVAFIETGWGGVITGNAMVSEYLDGFRNVEQHAASLSEASAGRETIDAFLNALAGAVNALCASGVYHADLSGKNVFTDDGERFYFIDLDGVQLGVDYTDERRMKNHAQLYDSFCDLFDDAIMEPFIHAMWPEGPVPDDWMARACSAQRKRRARVMARWRKQGRGSGRPPRGL
ncbi:MAG: hypothetical protein GWP08_00675 [Nitrospiraceae bacterium]|nr:hypothetical protein [Nitrospiraceae bacterium]